MTTRSMPRYEWEKVDAFVNRRAGLARLEEWWRSDEAMPVALLGRRRVGKSWLFRRLAHRKPAVILVAEQLAVGALLERFATQLEPFFGVRPEITSPASLVRLLFQLGRERKVLAVVDEFPWLLSTSGAVARRQLSAIQAVMEEERDASQLKLILCGSTVAQMESLFAIRNPLHGRLIHQEVRPLSFEHAGAFMPSLDARSRFERFAIAGGMPRYLSLLAAGSVQEAVTRRILDQDTALWDEGRLIVEQELRQPAVYFGILETLASGDRELNELAQATRVEGKVLARYLKTLVRLRLVRRVLPAGASPAASRSGHWRLDDPFLRFWFRFVFPNQASVEGGLDPADLYAAEVAPALASHVAPVFEEWCRGWALRNFGKVATQIDAWWGPALIRLRRSGERTSEEIDLVGLATGRVTLVGEAKWTNRRLGPDAITALDQYKLPALRQARLKVADNLRILLFSKSGYSASLIRLAEADPRITLVDVQSELASTP